MLKKKVLVVDDEADYVRLIQLRLEAHQYEVVAASDGEEALRKVESGDPDLITLDIKMPKMDGWTFVQILKKDEKGRRIPIVILTAHPGMQDRFRDSGVTDYVLKPFMAQDLLERIRRLLENGAVRV